MSDGSYYCTPVVERYIQHGLLHYPEIFVVSSVFHDKPPKGYVKVNEVVKFYEIKPFIRYVEGFFRIRALICGFVWLLRNCDDVFVRTPEPFSWFLSFFKHERHRILYYWASNPIELLRSQPKSPVRKFAKIAMFQIEYFLTCIACLRCSTFTNGKALARELPWYLRKRVKVVIESTTDGFDGLHGATKDNFNDFDQVHLLTVGRLQNGKGIEDVLFVLSEIQRKKLADQFVYTIVGDGPIINDLKQLVSAYDLTGKVFFSGAVLEKRELARIYRSSDIFVMPSHSETGPRVVLEAIYFGNFVISSDVGYVSTVSDRRYSIVYEPQDVARLEKAILWTFENKQKLQAYANLNKQLSKDYTFGKFFEDIIH